MTTTETRDETIKGFLALPFEALPSAMWMDEDASGSAWDLLVDAVRPSGKQRLDHFGDDIRLHADRDEWRDGVIVTV